jgi:hypothetical protein
VDTATTTTTMDQLKQAFPLVPEEDLESALTYANGEIELAMAMVGSALEFTVTPRMGIAIVRWANG